MKRKGEKRKREMKGAHRQQLPCKGTPWLTEAVMNTAEVERNEDE